MTTFVGTGSLIRLILRRDRVLLPLWVFWMGLLPVTLGSSIGQAYDTAAERAEFAALSAANGAFVALYGPLYGSGLGELTVWRAGAMPVIMGLFSLLLVIRHTRTEEDAGRRELVGSTVMTRHAPLVAVLIVTVLVNLVVAAVVATTMIGWGRPVAGSIAFGLQMASGGLVFAGIGALAAQLTEGAGAARGLAGGTLAVAYALRLIGDVSDVSEVGSGGAAWVSWLSPLGWGNRVQPFAGERWWIFLFPLAMLLLAAGAALLLAGRRDVGAGLLPTRPGPESAAASLGSPLGLAWRLHRGLLIGWLLGLAALGLVFGGVADGIGDLFVDSPGLQEVFTRIGGRGAIIDSYLVVSMSMVGLFAVGYSVQAAMRMRVEETDGRAEPVLATGVGRLAWLAGHLPFVVLAPALGVLLAGLVGGVVYGGMTGEVARQTGRMLGAAAVQLPAVWVVGCLALALFGALPRLAPAISWSAVAGCVLISLLGAALRFDQWLLDVSPFTHVPRYPGGELSALPLATLCLVALVLAGVGAVGFRLRDVPAN